MPVLKPIKSLKTSHHTCIELEIEHPFWNTQQLAKEMGVTRESVWNWQHSPLYQEELERRLHEEWKSKAKKAQAKMEELVESDRDDIAYKASAYLMDSTGYKPTDKVQVDANAAVEIKIDYGDD